MDSDVHACLRMYANKYVYVHACTRVPSNSLYLCHGPASNVYIKCMCVFLTYHFIHTHMQTCININNIIKTSELHESVLIFVCIHAYIQTFWHNLCLCLVHTSKYACCMIFSAYWHAFMHARMYTYTPAGIIHACIHSLHPDTK